MTFVISAILMDFLRCGVYNRCTIHGEHVTGYRFRYGGTHMAMVPKLNTMHFDKETPFQVVAPFEPMGDQPQAIEELAAGVENGQQAQVLLGATGTGKTYTIAKVIEKVQKPTLVIAHNKTLAAQLASEFKAFFPNNYVGYFVS